MNQISNNDLYDRKTILDCSNMKRTLDQEVIKISENDPDRDEKIHAWKIVRNISMITLKGECAERKERCLREWREKDCWRTKLLESAKPRNDIRCLKCNELLNFDFKTDWSNMNERERALLFYSCPNKCLPNRAFFNDGEEYISKPTLCKKCDGETDSDAEREGDVSTITWTCRKCGAKEVDRHDFSHEEKKEAPIDEALRKEYCLDEKGLESYRQMKRDMKSFAEIVEKQKNRNKDTKTNKRMKVLQRLRVTGLQEHVTKALTDIGMTKVELSHPTNDKGLRVRITMLDSAQDRSDVNSKKIVKKTLIESLHDTNWRLINSSLMSTLGAVSGELRGLTSDEELRKIIERENIANKKRTK